MLCLSFCMCAVIKLQHPTKGPIIYALQILPEAREGLICGRRSPSNQTSAGQTAYLMSEETCRTAKLLSGRLELRSAQVSFVSPPEPVWFVMGGSAKSAGGESELERGDKE